MSRRKKNIQGPLITYLHLKSHQETKNDFFLSPFTVYKRGIRKSKMASDEFLISTESYSLAVFVSFIKDWKKNKS